MRPPASFVLLLIGLVAVAVFVDEQHERLADAIVAVERDQAGTVAPAEKGPRVPDLGEDIAVPQAASVRDALVVDSGASADPTTRELIVLGESTALTLTVLQDGRRVRDWMVRVTDSSAVGQRLKTEVRQEGVTDRTGRVRFIIPARTGLDVQVCFPDGTWSEAMQIEGLLPGRQRMLKVHVRRQDADPEVHLHVTSTPSGRAIEGARVTLMWPRRVLHDVSPTVTDREGLVTVPADSGLAYGIAVDAHTPVEVALGNALPGSTIEIRLQMHAHMRGIIDLPETLRRLPFRSIGKVTARAPDGDRPGRTQLVSVELMSDGSWSFEDIEIPSGKDAIEYLDLRVETSTLMRRITERVRLDPGDDRFILDDWGFASPLTVRLQYPDGTPVASGLRVALHRTDGLTESGDLEPTLDTPSARSTTDARGVVSFGRVPVGRWIISVSNPLDLWFGVYPDLDEENPSHGLFQRRLGPLFRVSLDHIDSRVLSISLDGFGTITGYVERRDGTRVSNSPVHLCFDGTTLLWAATSDESGAFIVHLAPLDPDIDALASHHWLQLEHNSNDSTALVATRASTCGVVLVDE